MVIKLSFFISANRGEVIGKKHTWYVEDDHVGLLDDDDVQNQVLAILTGLGENHLDTQFSKKGSSLVLTINSPVDLHIYDNKGNHLGRGNLDIDENISGSAYYEWDHNKFAVLPIGVYDVRLNAIDGGSFSFTLDFYEGDNIEKSVVFRDVPIERGAVVKAKVTGTDTLNLALEMDYQNDGVADKVILPTVVLDSVGVDDLIPPTIDMKTVAVTGKNDWYTTDAVVNIEAYDDGGSGLLSVDYQINEGNIIPYSGPFTITGEGVSNITALAADGAGNTSNLLSKEIKIDKTAPVISAEIAGEYVYGETLNLNNLIKVSDNVSGVGYYKIYYDGTEISAELLLDQGGYHKIKVVAEDVAGNTQVIERDFEVYIPAQINFDPDTLNLKNDNPSVATVYISLPDNFSVHDIKPQSVQLNNTVFPIQDPQLGYVKNPVSDYDGDGKDEYMVKFNRSDLKSILEQGDSVEILITGKVSGITFKGKDTVRVIR